MQEKAVKNKFSSVHQGPVSKARRGQEQELGDKCLAHCIGDHSLPRAYRGLILAHGSREPSGIHPRSV